MKNYFVAVSYSLTFIVFSLSNVAFAQPEKKDAKVKMKSSQEKDDRIVNPLDTILIERVTGVKGKYNNGEYKITIPQFDLNVVVDGFTIVPAMGLSTWIAFTPSDKGAMVMGDIIVTETDLKFVQQEIIRQGFTITAIHNHFVRNHPNVMYMHIGGSGITEQMAQKAKGVLNKIIELRGTDPAKGTASTAAVTNSLNLKMLDEIIGYKAEMNRGVYKYTIGRPDVDLREHGLPVTNFLGFNTWVAWQGVNEKAAVAGDFTMLESEVAPVIKALVENDIEVVAVHNHMVHEKPKVFFLHYWGVGNSEKLAKGIRAALDQTGPPNKKNKMKH